MRHLAGGDVTTSGDDVSGDDVPAATPAPPTGQANPSARRVLIPPPVLPKRRMPQCVDITDESDTDQAVVLPRVRHRLRRRASAAGPNNLIVVHDRYRMVLDYIREQNCSVREACYRTRVAAQTIRDTQAIAEVKIVDEGQYKRILRECITQRVMNELKPRTVKEIETQCRRVLHSLLASVVQLRLDGKLLPASKQF
jgi:hypothetical protein